MTSHNQNDSWWNCQPGMLTRLSVQAQRRQRSQKIRRALGLTVVASVALFWLRPAAQRGDNATEIQVVTHGANVSDRLTCPVVLERCDPYLLGNISEQERQEIHAHLGHCTHCEVVYRQRAVELQVEFSVLVLPLPKMSFALYAIR